MPSTFIEHSWLPLLLADARLPTGGHAYSGGMEPALLGGLPPARAREFLIARARTTSIVDAGTAVAALTALTRPDGPGSLARVTRAWEARTPSAVQRATARQLGRGLMRVATRLWPEDDAVRAAVRHPAQLPRAVVLGVIATAGGLDAQTLARVSVYDDAQTAASALLKLEPLDPLTAASHVLAACSAADELIGLAVSATTPDAIPAFGAPQSEGWAEAHALLAQRLFHG